MKPVFEDILRSIDVYFRSADSANLRLKLSVSISQAKKALTYVSGKAVMLVTFIHEDEFEVDLCYSYQAARANKDNHFRRTISEHEMLMFFGKGPKASAEKFLAFADHVDELSSEFFKEFKESSLRFIIGEPLRRSAVSPDGRLERRKMYEMIMQHFEEERKEDEQALLASIARPKTTIESIKRQLDELVIGGSVK